MSTVVRGAAMGAVLGLAVTAGAVAADPPGRTDGFERIVAQVSLVPEANDPDQVQAFLGAWTRWRSLPVHVTATYTRTIGGAQVLAGLDVLAQRPPDEVRSSGGEVVALLDGERVVCSDAVDGATQCASSGPFDRQGLVDAEVTGFAEALDGSAPDYRLRHDGECFVLRRQRSLLAPPLRDRATYCFDGEGVLISAELADDDAVDRTDVVEVRPVTDDDLVLPAEGS